MPFKIVDTFYGARGGDHSFFGVCDEDRDRRRFDTSDDADRALEADRLDAEHDPGSEYCLERKALTAISEFADPAMHDTPAFEGAAKRHET